MNDTPQSRMLTLPRFVKKTRYAMSVKFDSLVRNCCLSNYDSGQSLCLS